jgi:hypothetical protein
VTDALTLPQIEEIKEEFAHDARIDTIARKLKLDPKVVREALADPQVAAEALVRKQHLYAVELVGLSFDRLRKLIEDGEPQHMLAATRLLHQLTSTDWLPQQRGALKEQEGEIKEIAGLLAELDSDETEE